jgi:hypothetical protein
MVDLIVSTSTTDVYMLAPVLWVPLDFLDDIIIRLFPLLGTGLPLLLV